MAMMNAEFDSSPMENSESSALTTQNSNLADLPLEIGTLPTGPNDNALNALNQMGVSDFQIDFSADNNAQTSLSPELAQRVDAVLGKPTVEECAGDSKDTYQGDLASAAMQKSGIPRNTGIGAVIGGIAGMVKGGVQLWVLSRYSSLGTSAIASGVGDLAGGATAGGIGGAILSTAPDNTNVGGGSPHVIGQTYINGKPYDVWDGHLGIRYHGADGWWTKDRNGQWIRTGK